MSNVCPRCGAPLERERRTFVGRALFRKVTKCTSCTYRARVWRLPFESTLTFVFSPYSRCIQCGSYRVKRLRGRDRIDGRSTHPLSVLLSLTLAPFYHCNPCRLQYHDWRPVKPSEQAEVREVAV